MSAQPKPAHQYPIIELFGPTIQGEGVLLGNPTHFLRFGGCGFKCNWCDSMHAVDPLKVKENRRMMSTADIAFAINQLPKAPWLTLTGGDPCIQEGLDDLIRWAWSQGIHVCVETQGEFFPEWLSMPDVITFSPKGPSSKMDQSITLFRDNLAKLRQRSRSRIAVKVVVFDERDLHYAFNVYNALHYNTGKLFNDFIFQVGSPLNDQIPDFSDRMIEDDPHGKRDQALVRANLQAAWKRGIILQRYNWLVQEVLKQSPMLGPEVKITPQTHTLLWPLEERGR